MPVTRDGARFEEVRSGLDRTPEKRKAGGSIPPLTTRLLRLQYPSDLGKCLKRPQVRGRDVINPWNSAVGICGDHGTANTEVRKSGHDGCPGSSRPPDFQHCVVDAVLTVSFRAV